jgi:hypothetical protein
MPSWRMLERQVACRAFSRAARNGEQNGRENGDDGDHDEKLYESKGSARTAHRFPLNKCSAIIVS